MGTLKLDALEVPGVRGSLGRMRERVLGGKRYLQLDCDQGAGRRKSTLLLKRISRRQLFTLSTLFMMPLAMM